MLTKFFPKTLRKKFDKDFDKIFHKFFEDKIFWPNFGPFLDQYFGPKLQTKF